MATGISGLVTDVRATYPLESATVTAAGAGGDQSTTTGQDGTFSIDLAVGTYDVTVTRDGYDAGDYPGIVVVENVQTDLRFALWPTEW